MKIENLGIYICQVCGKSKIAVIVSGFDTPDTTKRICLGCLKIHHPDLYNKLLSVSKYTEGPTPKENYFCGEGCGRGTEERCQMKKRGECPEAPKPTISSPIPEGASDVVYELPVSDVTV